MTTILSAREQMIYSLEKVELAARRAHATEGDPSPMLTFADELAAILKEHRNAIQNVQSNPDFKIIDSGGTGGFS